MRSIAEIGSQSDNCFRGVAQSGRVLGLGPRCRRFESFRPDQKIQTVAFAAVLIFCLERADSNDKILLSGSNLISFCYCGFHIGIYKSCLMFYNGVESNGFIGFGAVVARRRDMCR